MNRDEPFEGDPVIMRMMIMMVAMVITTSHVLLVKLEVWNDELPMIGKRVM